MCFRWEEAVTRRRRGGTTILVARYDCTQAKARTRRHLEAGGKLSEAPDVTPPHGWVARAESKALYRSVQARVAGPIQGGLPQELARPPRLLRPAS
jgi:hypothetical protein